MQWVGLRKQTGWPAVCGFMLVYAGTAWLVAFDAVTLYKLLGFGRADTSTLSACTLDRIPAGCSWHDATLAQLAAANRAVQPTAEAATTAQNQSWVPRHKIYIYWDVYANTSRHPAGTSVQAVISRQTLLLQTSGLAAAAMEIRIYAHGPTSLVATLPSWANVRTVVDPTPACAATSALWRDARNGTFYGAPPPAAPKHLVLYLHAQDVLADDWMQLLEDRNIAQWRIAAALLDDPAADLCTAGCEKWRAADHGSRGWHYSGNFWWAASDYLAQLPDPRLFEVSTTTAADSTLGSCGDYWLLSTLATAQPPEQARHFVLLATGPREGVRGSIRIGVDAVPVAMYTCTDPVYGLPSRTPCVGIDLQACHGKCCAHDAYDVS